MGYRLARDGFGTGGLDGFVAAAPLGWVVDVLYGMLVDDLASVWISTAEVRTKVDDVLAGGVRPDGKRMDDDEWSVTPEAQAQQAMLMDALGPEAPARGA